MATVRLKTYDWRSLLAHLAKTYGWDDNRCHQVMWIARTYGIDAEPIKGGILDVKWNRLENTYQIRERI